MTGVIDVFLENQKDTNADEDNYKPRIIKIKEFEKKHPGVLKQVGTFKDKDKLIEYLNSLLEKKKITNKERAYLKYLWICASKSPDIWNSINNALHGGIGFSNLANRYGAGNLASGAIGIATGTIFGMARREPSKQAITRYRKALSMEEVSLFIEDFRNLYNSALDLMYEYSNEEMPIEKVITYNEAAYILNNIL